jgi:hypothetical protein
LIYGSNLGDDTFEPIDEYEAEEEDQVDGEKCPAY